MISHLKAFSILFFLGSLLTLQMGVASHTPIFHEDHEDEDKAPTFHEEPKYEKVSPEKLPPELSGHVSSFLKQKDILEGLKPTSQRYKHLLTKESEIENIKRIAAEGKNEWAPILSYRDYLYRKEQGLFTELLHLKFKSKIDLIKFLMNKDAQKNTTGLEFAIRFPVTEISVDVWKGLLSNFHRLRKLGFSTMPAPYRLGPLGAKTLAPALYELKQLDTLVFAYNNLQAEGVKALAPAIHELVNLTNFQFQDNNFGVEGALALEPAFHGLANLTRLDFEGENLQAEGAKILAPAIGKLANLTTLYLANNNLGVDGAKFFEPAMGKLLKLTLLDLANNNLGVNGAKILAPVIHELTNLTELNLANNDLGVEGAKILAPVVLELRNLKTLHLNGNDFSSIEKGLFESARKRNSALRIIF